MEEERKLIERFQEETASMRAEIDELKTKVYSAPLNLACKIASKYCVHHPFCPHIH